jgi:hypothetical protein
MTLGALPSEKEYHLITAYWQDTCTSVRLKWQFPPLSLGT